VTVPRIGVSVDLVILTVRHGQLSTLAWRRDSDPYAGLQGLPGGFIRLDEDLPAAATRVLAERAGLPGAPVHLEQLRTYGYPDRDPTRRAVSVAYLGLAPDLPAPDQPQMSWQPVSALTELAFDHARILQDGVERARSKLEYTSLAAAFCQDEFTVGELRRVYEIVWGTALDPRNFHRKVTGARDFLVQTGTASMAGGRPAQLYRRGSAVLLYPPMLRSRDHGIGRRRPDSIEFPAASSGGG
jgi:8-oxo-dGTP diphosphatase